jgi:hypothetical protein
VHIVFNTLFEERISMRKQGLSLVAACLLGTSAHALTVTDTNDGATLVNALLAGASGITVDASSINVIGLGNQSGTYTGFSFAGNGTAAAPALNLGDGIVMTSGLANVANSNTSSGFSTSTGTGASSTIDAITGLDSEDQNRLTFKFTAGAGVASIAMNFIYASEEFPEFAGSEFADGFAFVVDGVNYAKFSDGSVVSLLSLASNANLFDNASSVYGIEYDGLTPVLQVTGLLDASKTEHTVEIVIADTGDSILNSAVYLSSLKGSSSDDGGIITPPPPPPIPEPETYALMLGGLALVGAAVRRRRQR